MKSLRKYYRVDRRQISYFRFVLEACDGIAVLSTMDPAQGVIALYVAPGCERELDRVVDGLRAEMRITAVDRSELACPDVL
jgi:hypothetical protein